MAKSSLGYRWLLKGWARFSSREISASMLALNASSRLGLVSWLMEQLLKGEEVINRDEFSVTDAPNVGAFIPASPLAILAHF
jgi:hypothetical protein